MPRWETCSRCGKAYNPNKYTAEERLLQAIYGEHLCPECQRKENASVCVWCAKDVLAPIFYNDEPYHSSCLAEMLGL